MVYVATRVAKRRHRVCCTDWYKHRRAEAEAISRACLRAAIAHRPARQN